MSIYFYYLKARKPTFLLNPSSLIRKFLACCIRFKRFCSNFKDSFFIHSLCGIALRITVDFISVVSSHPFFPLLPFSWVVALVEMRTARIWRMLTRSPMLARIHWVPCWFRFGLNIFHGWYNVTIADPGVDYIQCSCHRCGLYSFKEEDTSAGYKKKLNETE